MSPNPANVLAEAMAEAHALLSDQFECGRCEQAEILALTNGVAAPSAHALRAIPPALSLEGPCQCPSVENLSRGCW